MGEHEWAMKPIGWVGSVYTEQSGTPIQGVYAPDQPGTIEVLPEYEDGLLDIEGFSHIWVLHVFDRSEGYKLQGKPYLDGRKHGVFAMRAPRRPNPIGLSVVELVRREGRILHVKGVDMLDGTPVLDIKPYVPHFDVRQGRAGWLDEMGASSAEGRADDRFAQQHGE